MVINNGKFVMIKTNNGLEKAIITDGYKKTDDNKIEVCTEDNGFKYVSEDELEEYVSPLTVEEAIKIIADYNGHYCRQYQYQFNIKLHGSYEIPKRVKELCSEKEIWEQYDEILSDNLRCFMGGDYCDNELDHIISWVNGNHKHNDYGWWQDGRSGGWLIIADQEKFSIDSLGDAEEKVDEIETYLQQNEGDYYTEEDLKEAKEELETEEKLVIIKAEELLFIDNLIEHNKKFLLEYLSDEDAWTPILEPKLEELEEKEWVKQHKILDIHNTFHKDAVLSDLQEAIKLVKNTEFQYIELDIKIVERRI